MRLFRTLSLVAIAALLAACSATTPASRAATDPQTSLSTVGVAPTADAAVSSEPYLIAGYSISVPAALKVSEANVFYPIADIVWRGEPRGERHQQVKNIYVEAMDRATADLTSGRAVLVSVEVTRFHCLTEKSRYTVGGTHSLHFLLTLRDAATGEIIEGPRVVIADVKAAGGAIAVAEESQGLTQRVVVVNRLVEVLHDELTRHLSLNDPGPALLSEAEVAGQVPAL